MARDENETKGRHRMSQFHLVFRVHAIQRMFQRKINEQEVKQVVAMGQTIEAYPTDKPFPSRLILGWRVSSPPCRSGR